MFWIISLTTMTKKIILISLQQFAGFILYFITLVAALVILNIHVNLRYRSRAYVRTKRLTSFPQPNDKNQQYAALSKILHKVKETFETILYIRKGLRI